MVTTENMGSRTHSWLLGLVAVLLIANGFCLWQMTRSQREFSGRLREVEAAIHLYRYEARDHYGGFGMNALMSHLVYWAPKLQVRDATVDHEKLRQRLENILLAMSALGPDVLPLLERAITGTAPLTDDPSTQDEVRKWLLKGAVVVEREAGGKLLLRTLQANDFPVSFRLRLWAAQELVTMDEPLRAEAGHMLADILLLEAYRAPNTRPKTGHKARGAGQRPPYFNFVDPFVDSGVEEVERTLLMLIGKPRQELMILNTSVKALGKMKSERAAQPLQQIFATPPTHLHGKDAVLRGHCLDALDKILGPEILPFLKKVEGKVKTPLLRSKVLTMKSRYQ